MGRGSAIAHTILVASIVVFAFPLYYAFVISTQSLDEVTSLPPKLAPSTHLLQNYAGAWARAGMGRLLLNSTIVALALAIDGRSSSRSSPPSPSCTSISVASSSFSG